MKASVFFWILLCLAVAAPLAARADAPVRSGDTFELRIGGVPPDDQAAVSGTYTVDGGGGLTLPYLDKLSVSGLTSSQIQSLVQRSYVDRRIFTHPSVTLTFSGAPRFVNVAGHVKAPQRVNYTPDMTLLSAINAAGDFDEFADRGHVRLTSGDKVRVVNCKQIQKNPNLDIPVFPGDKIQVPESIF